MPEIIAATISSALILTVCTLVTLEYLSLVGDIINLFKQEVEVIHIKRRYENEKVIPVRHDAVVGTRVVELKQSREVAERVRGLKELAYMTFSQTRLLNVYFEFESRIKQIAIDGGDRYSLLSRNLKYGTAYTKDLNQAIDLITTKS